ncbi:muconolactone Delta-isomerase family protein [Rhodoplanes sp. TEM]|uniref:Muconolactone Delta-isomerase family protein n=1 Tax=Rhodoplanes tepidamans TaxID=200616 RepID=A0ABT5JAE2_RHOTP|nr:MULTISPECIES: muconolactone Delta-isomerase family protein [Rhodoplanes]MDC7786624.1 muconolactone Delta-isomerase family protein [Rhodoplanes tepidamans]MDC7983029.1 muconolactone Delta-isomerase family protein [Rhodoplanes sp. TEM]MDQ0356411.1 ketosteroid isomerase-like protein/muconolactone delta-isomerase [Rhodoplanes tepidamans]
MLFYVQMKWNYQGRISQDQLWDLEAREGDHGVEGIRAGFVQLYKVVSQHRIIAIVNAESLDDLDRNSMGWLPMREYLEFEQVWALRDYEGFLADVKARFPQPGQPLPAPVDPAATRTVATAWFHNMQIGRSDDAIALLDPDVTWDNVPPVPSVSDLAPWLGSYRGVPDVLASFGVWAAHSRMLSFTLQGDVMVDGERAVGIVHEHAQCIANGNEYDLQVATFLTVRNRKIVGWRVCWDVSPLVRAYRNL